MMTSTCRMTLTLALMVLWATLSSNVAGQEGSSAAWLRKSEKSLAEARALAANVKARANRLRGAELRRAEREIDKAIDAIHAQIDELDAAMDRNGAMDHLFKAQEVLYAAQELLFETQDAFDEQQHAGSDGHRMNNGGPRQELSDIDTPPKQGDQVVVLFDTPLKTGSEAAGAARKGERLTVERVQGKWLWVESNGAKGWIDSGSVLNAKLREWYAQLPDGESVEAAGRTRAKVRGVLFEIHNAGSPGLSVHANVVYADPSSLIQYGNVTLFLERRRTDRDWVFSVRFGPPAGWTGGLTPPPHLRGRPHGRVVPGDYVRIVAPARQVFVNGQLRRPQ